MTEMKQQTNEGVRVSFLIKKQWSCDLLSFVKHDFVSLQTKRSNFGLACCQAIYVGEER